MTGIVLQGACDMHTHLRGGSGEPEAIFKMALADTVRNFKRFLPMPNTHPKPIATAKDVIAYRKKIMKAAPDADPVMAIYLTKDTTPDMIYEAHVAGAKAVKYYPKGGTTNSEFGIEPQELVGKKDVLAAIAHAQMVLCKHGEVPYVLNHVDREAAFLPHFIKIAKQFPKLRIVFEHVSSKAGAECALSFPNVAVTVAIPHLYLTTADVIGDHGCLCMPVAKSEEDRTYLRQLLVSGNPRVLPGTDSAPHPQSKKDKERGAFGLYTARYAPAMYASIFMSNGNNLRRRDNLEPLSDFLCKYPAEWWQLPQAKGEIEIVQEWCEVPDVTKEKGFDPATSVKHFYAGRKLDFNIRYR